MFRRWEIFTFHWSGPILTSISWPLKLFEAFFLQLILNLYTKWLQKILVGFWKIFDCHSQHALLHNTMLLLKKTPQNRTITHFLDKTSYNFANILLEIEFFHTNIVGLKLRFSISGSLELFWRSIKLQLFSLELKWCLIELLIWSLEQHWCSLELCSSSKFSSIDHSSIDSLPMWHQRCKNVPMCQQCWCKKILSPVKSLQNFTLFCRESE